MKNQYKIYTLIILCVLFWSGNFIIGRYVKDDIEPFEMVFFRWGFTLVLISPILLYNYKRIINSIKNNFFVLFVLSLLGISLFNTLLYVGLNTTTSTNALIINSSIPMLILVFSFLLFKTKIKSVQILGILISSIGVLYLILKGQFENITLLEFTSGDLWVILSSISWALYSTMVKLKPKDISDMEYFSVIVLFGFIILLPIYLLQGYSLNHEIELIKNNYDVFIYISVFTSVISYYFWHQGIKYIGAAKTGQFTHLMPIFGTILAYIFLDEVLEYFHIIGAVLIALGIYLSLFYKRKLEFEK